MKFFVTILFFTVNLTWYPSSAQAQHRTLAGTWTEENSNLDAINKIKKMDPDKSSNLSEEILGYRSSLGVQFDDSCIKLLEQKFPHKKEEIYTLIDQAMESAATRITYCNKQYPELFLYTSAWAHSVRREIVKCVDKSSLEFDASAESNLKDKITLSRDTLFNLVLPLEDSSVVLNKNKAIGTFIHETFHNSGANNQTTLKHNEIEMKSAQYEEEQYADLSKVSCDENITMDRVSVLESLCAGNSFYSDDQDSFKGKAINRLLERMNICGIQRGCEDLFTGKANQIHSIADDIFFLTYPSKDLSQDVASKLCQKIKEDGACLSKRNTEKLGLTRSLPQVKTILEKLRTRLLSVLPQFKNQIPGSLLELYPEMKKKFKAIQNDPCFEAALTMGKDGTIFVRDRIYARLEKDNTILDPIEYFRIPSFVKTRLKTDLDGVSSQIKKGMQASPYCQEKGNEQNVIQVLEEFESLPILSKEEFGYFSKILDHAKEDFNSAPLNRVEYEFSKTNELKKLLGEDLLNEYFNVMESFYYDSPSFDCEAAGLSPVRSAERTTSSLDFLNKSLERKTCDFGY